MGMGVPLLNYWGVLGISLDNRKHVFKMIRFALTCCFAKDEPLWIFVLPLLVIRYFNEFIFENETTLYQAKWISVLQSWYEIIQEGTRTTIWWCAFCTPNIIMILYFRMIKGDHNSRISFYFATADVTSGIIMHGDFRWKHKQPSPL